MGRTVIREESTTPRSYVDDRPGSGLGVAVGILLGVLLVILAVLLLRGSWDDGSESPAPGTGNDTVPTAPAQPDQQVPEVAPS